jgi:hypothetical protein
MNVATGRIVVRPSSPTPSRATRWLGLLGFPWLFLVVIGTDAALTMLGLPPDERPLVIRVLAVVLAVVPLGLYVASPWLGRLPPLRWLFAWPQPEAELDLDGIRLSLPDRPDQYVPWSAVAGLKAANNWRRDSVLVGVDGQILATVPWSLAHPRSLFTARPLAQQVVELLPDRFALTGSNWAGLADQFGLRDAALPASSAQDSARRQWLVVGGVIALMLVVSTIAAIAWLSSPP